jgi:hypothetical protein
MIFHKATIPCITALLLVLPSPEKCLFWKKNLNSEVFFHFWCMHLNYFRQNNEMKQRLQNVCGKISWRVVTGKTYEGVFKSFRTGRLERELQMVHLSAIRCSCIAILWVSLVSFAAIILCDASQRVFIVVSVYFVIDSVRKLLDTHS